MRQATGFVENLLGLIGLDWRVPDFSTLCRRQKTLVVDIASRRTSEPPHLLIDSTGIKIEGEGEWHARKHGASSHRVWRKIHLAIDERTLEVCAVEVTGSNVSDAPDAARIAGSDPQASGDLFGHRRWPMTRASAMMPLPGAVPTPSYPHARMPNPGSPTPSVPGRETTSFAPPNLSADRCGDVGAPITGGAASRQR